MDKNAFSSYMENTIASGFVTFSIAIGRSTGLFKTMCDMETPATTAEIAESAKLRERYVKEWLGSMVAAKIVEVDPSTNRYHIPEDYREVLLTKTAYSEFLPVIGKKHDMVLQCFRPDCPPGYDPFTDDLFDLISKIKRQMKDKFLDDMLLQLDELKTNLENGITVADLGCGSGAYTVELAKRFPKSTIVGLDYEPYAIELAKQLANEVETPNVSFQTGDIYKLPETWTDHFDWILSHDVIHDLHDSGTALREIRRVLKPSGMFSNVEPWVHSSHYGNRGDQAACWYYVASMYVCLPSSMMCKPYAGHGACWGVEAIEEFLKANGATIYSKYKTINGHAHFVSRFDEL